MKRDLIIINSPINAPLCIKLADKVESLENKSDNCSVFLTTFGGDPDEAFKIGRYLQCHYSYIRLVVGSYCKSAGTLIAISANELIVGDHGELGPLDIQVIRGEDNPSRNSGLDFNSALNVAQNHVQKAYLDVLSMMLNNGASNNLATKVASQIAASIAPPLYSQIDPVRIAHMRRLITVALEYGNRLAEKSKSISIKQLTNLIADYPSHGFVIDREEAVKIFNKVQNLDDCHEELMFYKAHRDKILEPKKEKDAIVDVFAPKKEIANESNETPISKNQQTKTTRTKRSADRTTQND